MDEKTFRIFFLKNSTYILLILVCYILQEIPLMLDFLGAQPILAIAAVVSIAVLEGEFTGGLFGLFAGFLCDVSAFHLFGIASITFSVLGTACGLFVIYLIQPNLRTVLLLSFGFAITYGSICFYVIYGIWNYDNSGLLFVINTIPNAMLTALWTLPIYFITSKVYNHFPIPK